MTGLSIASPSAPIEVERAERKQIESPPFSRGAPQRNRCLPRLQLPGGAKCLLGLGSRTCTSKTRRSFPRSHLPSSALIPCPEDDEVPFDGSIPTDSMLLVSAEASRLWEEALSKCNWESPAAPCLEEVVALEKATTVDACDDSGEHALPAFFHWDSREIQPLLDETDAGSSICLSPFVQESPSLSIISTMDVNRALNEMGDGSSLCYTPTTAESSLPSPFSIWDVSQLALNEMECLISKNGVAIDSPSAHRVSLADAGSKRTADVVVQRAAPSQEHTMVPGAQHFNIAEDDEREAEDDYFPEHCLGGLNIANDSNEFPSGCSHANNDCVPEVLIEDEQEPLAPCAATARDHVANKSYNAAPQVLKPLPSLPFGLSPAVKKQLDGTASCSSTSAKSHTLTSLASLPFGAKSSSAQQDQVSSNIATATRPQTLTSLPSFPFGAKSDSRRHDGTSTVAQPQLPSSPHKKPAATDQGPHLVVIGEPDASLADSQCRNPKATAPQINVA